MQFFRYKAINENGRYVKGKISAENASDLTTTLHADGLELVSYKEEARGSSLSFLDKVTEKDLISVFVHLEQLERAGVSIMDSINDLKVFE